MLRDLAGQDAGDEVAGNDEEDVDPDIAAAENTPAGMEKQNGQDGHGAQAIDLCPILHRDSLRCCCQEAASGAAKSAPEIFLCQTRGLRAATIGKPGRYLGSAGSGSPLS